VRGAIGLCLFLLITPLLHAADSDEDQTSQVIQDELAPPPEYPYPGASEEGFGSTVNATTNAAPTPAPSAASKVGGSTRRSSSPQQPQAPLNVERPKYIDEDGNYYYGHARPEDAMERKADDLHVPPNEGKAATQAPLNTEKPVLVDKNGGYHYKLEDVVTNRSASFRLGVSTPPAIENPKNGLYFKDIYGKGLLPIAYFDYEFQLTRRFGDLGIKLGTGLMFATGNGRFDNPNRIGDHPDTKLTFFMMPNTASAVYKIRYFKKQPIVPFVEGGIGYFTFGEIRDDGKPAKFGAAAVATFAGGLNLLLDWLDPESMLELNADYGIGHVWLTFEARQDVGLNRSYDFTSTSGNAGFSFDF
jgi:hypothetical protein